VLVDNSFSKIAEAPNWWPIDAQKETMIETWNDFVDLGEVVLGSSFNCREKESVRICEKK